ncbi:TPA: hypothetical protein LR690_001904, partial [Listeria monocytogenes]|nr:hypothetical protein [Listeria monocytogenes]HBL6194255.1 hypothetical protein [Listeria monocytogenes]
MKIEFRAWDKEVMKMDNNPTVLAIWQKEPINEQFKLESEEKLVWMQYTNVNTHRGEKIFQGDVVTVKHTEVAYKIYTPFSTKVGYAPSRDFIGVVEFLEGMWVVNNRVDKMIPLWSETNEIEILGNIWDNPELLEV